MNSGIVKFKCQVADLVNALEKHAGVRGVIIESSHDAEGAINSLMGVLSARSHLKCPNCELEGPNVTVHLMDDISDGSYPDPKQFVAGVKELQQLIFGEK